MAPLRGISIGDLFDLFCTTAAACGRLIPFSTREHFFFFEQDTLVAVSTIILYSLESTIAPIQLFEASFHSSQHCWKASVLRIEATNIQEKSEESPAPAFDDDRHISRLTKQLISTMSDEENEEDAKMQQLLQEWDDKEEEDGAFEDDVEEEDEVRLVSTVDCSDIMWDAGQIPSLILFLYTASKEIQEGEEKEER